MTVRPGYISDGNNNWIQIGPAVPVGSTVYYQASEPSSPQTGDIWIDADNDVPSIDNSQFLRWRETAVGGETSLSGNDDNGLSLQYTPGYEQVYLNGVLLVRGSDYTATTGTSITGLTALAANDVVEVFSVVARVVGDVYTQSQSDDKYSPITTTGLVLLNSTDFSSAANVTIDNVFSSSYRNYKMVIDFTASSGANGDISWYGRSGSPAADTTSNYVSPYIRVFDTTVGGFKPTTGFLGGIEGTYASYASITADIIAPNVAKATKIFSSSSHRQDGGSTLHHNVTSWQTDATQFTGIKIYPSGGTISGSIRIYGYK